ncbi:MAG: hypothetical protein Q7S63_02285 [bacterium]|nr:hypothetical protein [bacterium]
MKSSMNGSSQAILIGETLAFSFIAGLLLANLTWHIPTPGRALMEGLLAGGVIVWFAAGCFSWIRNFYGAIIVSTSFMLFNAAVCGAVLGWACGLSAASTALIPEVHNFLFPFFFLSMITVAVFILLAAYFIGAVVGWLIGMALRMRVEAIRRRHHSFQ